MKYSVQSKLTRLWVASIKWENNEWQVSWCESRQDSKPLDRFEVTWLLDSGRIANCECYRAEIADVRAPDGIIAHGLRKVSKKGTVRFASGTWTHEKLLPLAGKTVMVQADEYWITHPHVFFPPDFEHNNLICSLNRVEKDT